MNIFARFDENPAMTLQDIKKTKRYKVRSWCVLVAKALVRLHRRAGLSKPWLQVDAISI